LCYGCEWNDIKFLVKLSSSKDTNACGVCFATINVLNERNYVSKENYSLSDDEEHCKLQRNIFPLHLQIVSKLPLSRGHVQFSFTIDNCCDRGECFLGFDVLKNPLYLPSFFLNCNFLPSLF
jgi:hypothetical protein